MKFDNSYKQDCGIRVPESHVLKRRRSTFLRFDEVGVASRSWILDSVELGIGVRIAFGDFGLRQIILDFYIFSLYLSS